MRIGIDIRALMEERTTGVQVYVENLLRALFARDRVNEYVLFANSLTDIKVRVARFAYPNAKYRVRRFPNKLFNLAQKFLRAPGVEKLFGKIDLLFSPHWRVLALTPKIPTVITFHDLAFDIASEFFTLRQRLWHWFMNYRKAAEAATAVVAVSQSTKTDLVNYYRVPAEKIRVIYPGTPARLGERNSLFEGQLPKQKYFLFFGTFEPRKNLEAVLAAYQSYFQKSKSRLPLVLAGNSGWKMALEMPQELKDWIFVFQNVTESQKSALYEKAFAFLFLSFYEGFGFPVLEAASFGVPVIATSGTSIAEIGGDFVLLVNPFRPGQVAEAMLALEQEPDYYRKLQQRGRQKAVFFSWDESARQMLELFQELKT